jgi:hypothetical protein
MKIDSILSSDAHWNVNKAIAKKIGIVPTILLMELIFCRKKYGQDEFFETAEKLEQILGIGEDARRSATKALVNLGLVTMTRKGTPARWFYILNDDKIFEIFSATSDLETPPLKSGNPATSDLGDTVTINKNEIKNTIKKEESVSDPFIPKHDFEGSKQVHDILSDNCRTRYHTAIQSDPTHCNSIYQLLISDDKESELKEKLLQYEYSWWGEQKKQPTAKNVFKSWDQLSPDKVPLYARKGYKTESEMTFALRREREQIADLQRQTRVKTVVDEGFREQVIEAGDQLLKDFEQMKKEFA